MPDLLETVDGGLTRTCAGCGVLWAVDELRETGEKEPCPECGHEPEPGEDVYDFKTCPGCGTDVSGHPSPVSGFPGQRWCSAECAGLL